MNAAAVFVQPSVMTRPYLVGLSSPRGNGKSIALVWAQPLQQNLVEMKVEELDPLDTVTPCCEGKPKKKERPAKAPAMSLPKATVTARRLP